MKPKRIVTLILPFVTPSNNELIRMHYRARMKMKQFYYYELLAIGANADKYKVQPFEKRKITVLSFRKRLMDYDNLIGGGLKLLIDCLQLKEISLIFDDSPAFLEWGEAVQKVSKEAPKTVITIFKVEGNE